ncbi:glutathione S-transferase N-terminal domain-containing protein [Scytonema hofmannii]|uniref:glutathione S-transferase N-terminal domain-containing protein n=1 Tax=Scytonema hofmannii TaxID=34078 RepID=UPI003AF33045
MNLYLFQLLVMWNILMCGSDFVKNRIEMKLYHNPISPNSRRVWITLMEKGLPRS